MPQDTNHEAVVYIVDDGSVRLALDCLFRSVGLQTRSYGSAQEFLDASPEDRLGCIVLDVRLPGMSGLDFQEKLADPGNRLPVILMTGQGDIPMSVWAMTRGAMISYPSRSAIRTFWMRLLQRSNVIVSGETLTAPLQKFFDPSSRDYDCGCHPDGGREEKARA